MADVPANHPPAAPEINPWIVAIAVMLGTFMEVLDTTVVNVSLPHIAGSLSATVDESTWTLTSYLVANAIVLPITGWLANYFGRKRLLIMAVMGFTIASFLCGFAPNLPALIIFRIIQGASGGALQPLSQAVLLETFPPQDRGKAMGFWGLGIVVAPMLGPVLGGWLTDNYSWRWIFYINVPIGVLAVIMTRMFIFDPPYIRRTSEKIDTPGICYLALGVGCLQVMLDKGQEEDWFSSRFIVILAVLTAVGFIAFLVRELRTSDPVVHLRVMKDRTYSTGVFLMTVVGFVLYGSLVLLPLFLQELLGYPALQAGIAMAPRGLGSFIAMPLVGTIVSRFDPRKMLALGIIGAAYTLYELGRLNLNAGYWDIFWPQFLQGFSMAFLFVPLTTVTMDPIPKPEMGNATSIFNLMRNIGGSVGIASATTLLALREQSFNAVLNAHFNPYNYVAQRWFSMLRGGFMAGGADAGTANGRAYAALHGIMAQHASMLSFNSVFLFMAMVFLGMLPLMLLLKKPQSKSGGMPVH
jgi:DHA2 family multidrug resistance protein